MADMDLSSYTGLKAAIADFVNRSDLANQIPGFITLAEAKIRRRLRRKTARASVVFNAESYVVPAAVAEVTSVRLITGSPAQDRPLTLCTPEQLAEHRAVRGDAAGRPRFFAVVGSTLVLAPTPDDVYDAEITYFVGLTPLSGTVATNYVLAEAPDAYLYGALAEAAPFLEHDERIPVWQARFDAALDELNLVGERERNPSLKPARLPVVFGAR